METVRWPTTLHCDLGCDNYDSVPWDQGQYLCRTVQYSTVQCFLGLKSDISSLPELYCVGCFVPEEDLQLARQQYQWWKNILGPFYRGFFDSTNNPKKNFKKIQHLKVWSDLLSRYPGMTAVWAHLGLSKVTNY